MAVRTFEMTIKLPKTGNQKIRVQADNPHKAREMAEAQYGKGCIIGNPREIKP